MREYHSYSVKYKCTNYIHQTEWALLNYSITQSDLSLPVLIYMYYFILYTLKKTKGRHDIKNFLYPEGLTMFFFPLMSILIIIIF